MLQVFTLLFAGLLAQAAAPASSWTKACDAQGQHCGIEQIALAEPGNRPVLRLRFENDQEGRAKIIVLAPLGILLRPGLDLVVDAAAPIKLPFEHCTMQGCEVSAILDRTALESFVKGTALTIRYAPTEAQTASVPLKLEGLAAALSSLPR